jgi:hypothetical protein
MRFAHSLSLATFAFAFGTLGAFSTTAGADDTDNMKPEAKTHFDQGSALFAVQRYGEAVTEFQDGYLADHQPVFLYAIGQAERLNGDCKDAVNAYHQYLNATTASDDPVVATKRQNAQAMIDQCGSQPSPATAPAAKPPKTGATSAATTTTKGTTHPAPPTPTPPKTTAPTKSKVLQAAQPAVTPPSPSPAPPTGPPGPAPFYKDPLGDGLALAGIAGVAVGAVYVSMGNSEASSANQAATNNTGYSGYSDHVNAAKSDMLVGDIALAAGGALVAASIVRYTLLHRAETASPTVTLAPLHGGAAFGLAGTF